MIHAEQRKIRTLGLRVCFNSKEWRASKTLGENKTKQKEFH